MANRTVTAMKEKVGKFLSDTSAATYLLILDWIDDKYKDIWSRMNWSVAINEDYTFESVASQATYDLPLDFEHEIFVTNLEDGKALKRETEGSWWNERYSAYSGDSISAGAYPERYKILKQMANSTATGFGKIALDPAPSAIKTFAMPYKRKYRRLINTTDTCTTDTANKIIAAAATFITDGVEPGMVVKNTTDGTYGYVSSVDLETQLTMETDLCPDGNESIAVQSEIFIPDIDYIIELGVIAEGFAYKSNFPKADYYNMKYESELAKRIHAEKAVPNQLYQVISPQRVNGVTRLTGDLSYDSLT